MSLLPYKLLHIIFFLIFAVLDFNVFGVFQSITVIYLFLFNLSHSWEPLRVRLAQIPF